MPRCCDCGFLALRNVDRPNEYFEAPPEYRDEGNIFGTAIGAYQKVMPVCVRGAAKLYQELALVSCESPDLTDAKRRALVVIGEERDCKAFEEWTHGITPKEQLEMFHEEKLQLRHEERMQKQQEWQEERRQEDIKRAERDKWEERIWVAIVGIIAFFLGGLFR